jgi:hypothetical protein
VGVREREWEKNMRKKTRGKRRKKYQKRLEKDIFIKTRYQKAREEIGDRCGKGRIKSKMYDVKKPPQTIRSGSQAPEKSFGCRFLPIHRVRFRDVRLVWRVGVLVICNEGGGRRAREEEEIQTKRLALK